MGVRHNGNNSNISLAKRRTPTAFCGEDNYRKEKAIRLVINLVQQAENNRYRD